ncbi:unnamed protein product [Urochloa decumbens]|uniref:Uncharacterized protein n=1 Tax=Urochloa decumbens TaxID=240449 RepID=A0ABC9BLC0_9POAL
MSCARAQGSWKRSWDCGYQAIIWRTYKDDGFDDFHVERELEVGFVLYPQKHVDKVLVHAAAAAAGGHPLLVLLDDAVDDPEHGVVALMGAAHDAAEPADEAGRRPQVGRVEPGGELDGAVERPQEHVAALEPVAHHGAHRGVRDERRQPRVHLHHRARRRRLGARTQRGGDLLLADGAEGLDAARAEELDGADLPELAPVVAVGREDDVPAVVEDHAQGGAKRPRRERQVVGLHHLARRLPGRDHNRGHLADPEQHHRPVAPRKVAHGAVRELARDVVQAADDRQLPRPRRQPQAMAVSRGAELALREHDEQRHEG